MADVFFLGSGHLFFGQLGIPYGFLLSERRGGNPELIFVKNQDSVKSFITEADELVEQINTSVLAKSMEEVLFIIGKHTFVAGFQPEWEFRLCSSEEEPAIDGIHLPINGGEVREKKPSCIFSALMEVLDIESAIIDIAKHVAKKEVGLSDAVSVLLSARKNGVPLNKTERDQRYKELPQEIKKKHECLAEAVRNREMELYELRDSFRLRKFHGRKSS